VFYLFSYAMLLWFSSRTMIFQQLEFSELSLGIKVIASD